MVGLQVIDLKEGQFITGRFSGAKELKLNPSTFYKYLKMLEAMQMLELKSNNKMTVVSIENWTKYQNTQNEKYQQNNNKITTKEQQNNTNNNGNNANKSLYSDFVDKMLPIYPGKKIKAVRDKRLPKILEQYSEDEILRAVNRYAAEVAGKEKQFILNESTFWNSRYVDYLDENYEEEPRYNLGSEKYL